MILRVISTICVICILCLAVAGVVSCIENRTLSVSHYRICSEKIHGSLRAVFVCDLHNALFGKDNRKLFEKIDALSPEVVFIPGDIIVGKPGASMDIAIHFLQELGKKYRVYVSKGNHEMRTDVYRDLYGDMWDTLYEQTKASVTWLINEAVCIGNNICVTGLDMDSCYYRRFSIYKMEKEYLENLLPALQPKRYNLLLAHNPDYFANYAEWGADLSLSGHVHGGMVILPLLGGVVSPMVKLFPKYYKGMYQEGEKRMIVSGGLGSHTLRFRVNNKPDISLISFEEA